MKLRSLLVSVAASALVAAGLAATPAHAVDPVLRVSCPSLADVSKAAGITFTHSDISATSCSYSDAAFTDSWQAKLYYTVPGERTVNGRQWRG